MAMAMERNLDAQVCDADLLRVIGSHICRDVSSVLTDATARETLFLGVHGFEELLADILLCVDEDIFSDASEPVHLGGGRRVTEIANACHSTRAPSYVHSCEFEIGAMLESDVNNNEKRALPDTSCFQRMLSCEHSFDALLVEVGPVIGSSTCETLPTPDSSGHALGTSCDLKALSTSFAVECPDFTKPCCTSISHNWYEMNTMAPSSSCSTLADLDSESSTGIQSPSGSRSLLEQPV